MPVASINIAPVLPESLAPTASSVPGTAPRTASAALSNGLKPDFQAVLSGQTPPAAAACDELTPGTVASALAAGPEPAPKVSAKAFSAIAAAATTAVTAQGVGPATPAAPARPPKAAPAKANASGTQAVAPHPTAAGGLPVTASVPAPVEALADAVAAQATTPGTVESIETPASTNGRPVPPRLPNAGVVAAAAAETSGEVLAPAATAPAAEPASPVPAPANVVAPALVRDSGTIAAASTAAPVIPGTVASIAASLSAVHPGAAPTTSPTTATAASAAAATPAPAGGNTPGASTTPATNPVVRVSLPTAVIGTGSDANRPGTDGGEKFAESNTGQGVIQDSRMAKPIKTAVHSDIEEVTTKSSPIGMSAALSTPVMSPSTNSQPFLASVVSSAAGLAPSASEISVPVTALATPSQAVANVLQIADIQAAQAQATPAAVNLHFTVGGENLSVRIALQDGQVHTQFTTDSSSLRSALAHEWQAVSSESNSTVRFAEPVFTSGQRSDSRAGADLAGQGGYQANRGRDQAETGTGNQPSSKPARPTQTAAVPLSHPAASDPVVLGRLHSFA